MRGYIAITTVLTIGVIVLVISLTTTLTSVNQSQFSLNRNFAAHNLTLTESCIDEALIKLNLNNTVPSNISLPQGNCNLTINSQVGSSWNFTVTSSQNTLTRSVRLDVTRGTIIQINSWQEI